MYACYETTLSAGELDGSRIEAVGFSASQSGLHIVNTCNVSLVKTPNEPLYICGTMVLNTLGDNFAFLSGDNKLVRMLLGTEIFSFSTLTMICGTENTPQDGYTYVQGVTPSSLNPVWGDNEISISKTLFMPLTDIVLLSEGKPVLRVMADVPEKEETVFLTAPQNDYITVNVTDKVVGIKDLKVITLAVDFTAVRLPSGLAFKKTAKVKLPSGVKIKKDATGRFFGYAGGGRAAAFTLESGEIKISRFFAGRDIVIADDGAVFVIKDDGAVFLADSFSTDGGGGVLAGGGGLIPLNITAGEKYAAAYRNGAYVFGTLRAGRAVFYKIKPPSAAGGTASVSVLSDTGIYDTSGAHVFAMPSCVNIICRAAAALSFEPDGAALKKAWLDGVIAASWFADGVILEYDAGKLILYNPYVDQSMYYVDMKNTLYAPSGYGRFYGEFKVRNRAATTEVSAIGGVSALATEDGKTVYAATYGRFLYLFLENGTTRAYYIKSQSQKLYAGAITQGQTVSYVLRSVAPSAEGAVILKIKSETAV